MDLEFDVKDYQELLKILNEIKHYTHNHNLIEKKTIQIKTHLLLLINLKMHG